MTTDTASPAAALRGDEWPLVLFTTMAISGAGLLATPLVAAVATGAPALPAAFLLWGTLLLGGGLAVSLAHLGRPLRAPLAGLGVGRSRLSTEIVLSGLALAGGISAVSMTNAPRVLDVVTATAAVACLVSIGFVYNLPGQHTWRGTVAWTPLTTGLGLGAVALSGTGAGTAGVAAAVLAADTVLFAGRWRTVTRWRVPLAPAHPRWFARRTALLALRLALVDVLPCCLVLAGAGRVATCVLGLGILVDRASFYLLAARQTTEAGLACVEWLL